MSVFTRIFSVTVASVAFVAVSACATDMQDQSAPAAEAPAAEATSAEPAPAPASSAPKAKADGNDIVCKRIDSTGSNFKRRECKTVDEWDAEREASQDAMDRIDRKNREGCVIGQQCN